MAFRINVFAILSLVFSIVFFPLGLAFGIIALRQIAKSGQQGKGLAIAGTTISSFILLFIFIAIFTEDSSNLPREQNTQSAIPKVPSQPSEPQKVSVSPAQIQLAMDRCELDPELAVFYPFVTDVCYKRVAIELNEPALCDKIEMCVQNSLQLDCYSHFAVLLKDASYCDKIICEALVSHSVEGSAELAKEQRDRLAAYDKSLCLQALEETN